MGEVDNSCSLILDTMSTESARECMEELEKVLPGQLWIVAPFSTYGLAMLNYRAVDKKDMKTLKDMEFLDEEEKTRMMIRWVITGDSLKEGIEKAKQLEEEKSTIAPDTSVESF